MKQTSDIQSGHSITFNAGQAGKYLILREASQSVILKGNDLRPVELERGDVVDVSQYDELALHNHNATSVHIEFQVADVEVRIKNSSTSINGALNIDEIESPVVISRIQEPIDVQVEMPGELSVANFPQLQQVEVTNQPQRLVPQLLLVGNYDVESSNNEIPGNANRDGLVISAPGTNQSAVYIAGNIPIYPGAVVTIPASNNLAYQGTDNDIINVHEVIYAVHDL